VEKHAGATKDAKKAGPKRSARAGGEPAAQRRKSPAAQAKREERERRQVQRRRAARIRATAIGGTALAIAALAIAVYSSALFTIETVEVVGAVRIDADEVRTLAAVPAEATLLRFDAETIEARVLANPWIGSVSISRDFPSTLRIRVVERQPAALVDGGDVFWVVDAEGMVLGQASLETSSTYVVVRDVPGFDPEPGRTSNTDPLVNALRVLSGIGPQLRDQVKAVSAPSVDETALILSSGVEVMLGEATQLEEKTALVLGIIEEKGSGVVFIDVRSISRPISRGIGE
jgi:cell division protein FtsQ